MFLLREDQEVGALHTSARDNLRRGGPKAAAGARARNRAKTVRRL